VHSSNFRPLKRATDVVRIYAKVRETRRDAQLILAGTGPESAAAHALAAQIGGNIKFAGDQLDPVPLLQSSDVFLLPSLSESFGLAALEALACGVPVVASSVGGLPEVVRDGETGFLRPAGDIDAMAAATLALLDDLDRFRTAARADALARFPRDAIIARWESLYGTLV
jgi:glycosyltransferase involved in cell wall biosynthesis